MCIVAVAPTGWTSLCRKKTGITYPHSCSPTAKYRRCLYRWISNMIEVHYCAAQIIYCVWSR